MKDVTRPVLHGSATQQTKFMEWAITCFQTYLCIHIFTYCDYNYVHHNILTITEKNHLENLTTFWSCILLTLELQTIYEKYLHEL